MQEESHTLALWLTTPTQGEYWSMLQIHIWYVEDVQYKEKEMKIRTFFSISQKIIPFNNKNKK